MARARTIKPGFFKNEDLAEVAPLGRLLFAGLWTVADRDGRLEDRPKRIKADILPYDDCDPEELLDSLVTHGFITRYVTDGHAVIQVLNFDKHQSPHPKEPDSQLPVSDLTLTSNRQDADETVSENALTHVLTFSHSIPSEISGSSLAGESEGTAVPAADAAPPSQPKVVRSVPKSEKRHPTKIPKDWQPSSELWEWATGKGWPAEFVQYEAEQFVDYWTGDGGTKDDWTATFRTWLRNAAPGGKFAAKSNGAANGRASPNTRQGQSDAVRSMLLKKITEDENGLDPGVQADCHAPRHLSERHGAA